MTTKQRYFASLRIEGDLLSTRSIEVPFANATRQELRLWLQASMGNYTLDEYRRIWEFHRALVDSPSGSLVFTPVAESISPHPDVAPGNHILDTRLRNHVVKRHGIGWLLHLEFFVPKTLLEPWYRELLETCDQMIDAGKSRWYIRAAVISQLALLLASRAKLLSLEAIERVAAGLNQIAR